jgi:hypothetical protein
MLSLDSSIFCPSYCVLDVIVDLSPPNRSAGRDVSGKVIYVEEIR